MGSTNEWSRLRRLVARELARHGVRPGELAWGLKQLAGGASRDWLANVGELAGLARLEKGQASERARAVVGHVLVCRRVSR